LRSGLQPGGADSPPKPGFFPILSTIEPIDPGQPAVRRLPGGFIHRHLFRLTPALVLLFSVAAAAQTADDIVAKNLQAKGGAEKWQSVNSVKTTGKITIQGQVMPITVYAKRPNLNRREVALAEGRVIEAFDGTTGWMINPMTGSDAPQLIPAAAVNMMKNAADFDGALINYKSKGTTIDLVGKEQLRDKDVYHLKVTMTGGQVQHYFVDAESGIELKTSAEVEMGMAGTKQSLETEMSNYKAIDGIMVPHTVKQSVNGKPMVEMTITAVEFNPPLPDDFFRMPKK
jgi:outer membrane lipoprotein-sorting protein